MSEFVAVLCLNTANIIYVLSYGVRDLLWLRILAVAAMMTLLPYYFWGPPGFQASCVCWQSVFIAINVAWIIYLIQQSRPPKMTQDQKRIYNTVFRKSCTPRQMLKILESAKPAAIGPNTMMVKKGTDPHQLILIDRGDAVVQVDGERVGDLNKGDFVAEMSFLTGKPSLADIISNGPVRYLVWRRADLEKLFENQVELKSIMNEIIGRNLVRKITAIQTGAGFDSLNSLFSVQSHA